METHKKESRKINKVHIFIIIFLILVVFVQRINTIDLKDETESIQSTIEANKYTIDKLEAEAAAHADK